jgi:glycosyltransferase involved in cell wall biosynthesis
MLVDAGIRLVHLHRSITLEQFDTLINRLGTDVLDYNCWETLPHIGFRSLSRHCSVPIVAHYHCTIGKWSWKSWIGCVVIPQRGITWCREWRKRFFYDAHIVCYQKGLERAKRRFGPINQTKVYGVPCGIPLSNARVEPSVLLAEPRFIQVGKLISNKRPFLTLEAFLRVKRLIPDATLTFVGDGDLMPELCEILRKENITDVHVIGETVDVEPYYCRANINVLPSKWEAMPFVLKEAAALGLPNITTGRDGQGEVVLHGKTGWIVPEDDPDALTDAMLSLARDPKTRQRMGTAGRRWVRDRFSVETTTRKLLEVYQQVQERRHI